MPSPEPGVYRFGEFELNLQAERLTRNGKPVKLQPQPLKVLSVLVEQSGQVVTREQLRTRVWDEATFVEFDQGVNYCIRQIRIALGDSAGEPVFIETLPKQGYRFIALVEAAVSSSSEDPPSAPSPPSTRHSWFGRRLALALILLTGAAALGGVAFWINRIQSQPKPRKILVLPLANRTGDRELDYLASGTSIAMIRRLGETEGLRVLATATTLSFQGRTVQPRDASRMTGADTIVSGAIRRESGDIVAELEAADGKDDTIIWNRAYDQLGTEPQAFLSAIANDLATSLHLRLEQPAPTQSKKPSDPTQREAWNFYLRGEHALNSGNPNGLHEALQYFGAALKRDPKSAASLAGLASAHTYLGLYFEDPRDHLPLAKTLASRALRLDDSLREAEGVVGLVALVYDWNFKEAQRHLVMASGKLRPDATTALACTSHLMTHAGRLAGKAEDSIREHLALNPLSVPLLAELGCTAYYERRFERAIQAYNQALSLDPNNTVAIWGLGKTFAQLGKYDEALSALSRAASGGGAGGLPPVILGEEGYVRARIGDRKGALQAVQELRERAASIFVDPYFVAEIYQGLGDVERSISALEDALSKRSSILISIHSDPKWDGMDRHRRFAEVLHQIGY